ncbi:MAG: peptidoglycan bridge formation glycyltransferase FemA/FemB family protein, partial [Anaerolineales bacterium]|nr:peptidoglycan bridge formation glycyltransferase FemA/FemB family protein [Anaerolineales bacterium]
MTEVTLSEWNQFIANHPNAHLLQMGEWGELKKDFGWKPVRIISENIGAQILFRKLPLGFTIGYMPKLVDSGQWTVDGEKFWDEVDLICTKNHAVFLKVEPDAWIETFQLSNFLTFQLSK